MSGCEACGGYFRSEKGGEFKANPLIPGPKCEWILKLNTTKNTEILLTFKVCNNLYQKLKKKKHLK